MFTPHEHQGRVIGYEYISEMYHVFFGCKGSDIEVLQGLWPYQFDRLTQVHGNLVISANPEAEADGHWTMRSHQALAIKTADCVPVMLAGPGFICAIHAGWRGVASNIVGEALEVAFSKKITATECQIYIGPHIGKQFFEVETDVLGQLQRSVPDNFDFRVVGREAKFEGKFLVDLLTIVRMQIAAKSVPEENVHECNGDTFADENFHSFRRDGSKAGRQISFIALR